MYKKPEVSSEEMFREDYDYNKPKIEPKIERTNIFPEEIALPPPPFFPVMISPIPWGVDNTDKRFPVIRDNDGEIVCGGTYELPLGTDDANLIVKAVNEYKNTRRVR